MFQSRIYTIFKASWRRGTFAKTCIESSSSICKVYTIRRFHDYNSLQAVVDNLKSITDLNKSLRKPHSCRHIQSALRAMDAVHLDDTGFTNDFVLTYTGPALCLDIFKLPEKLHVALFLIPRGQGIPLHDHPNMTVLTKVLSGSMRLNSYTEQHEEQLTNTAFPRDAHTSSGLGTRIKSEAYRWFHPAPERVCTTSTDAWLLEPTDGNIHAVYASPPGGLLFLDAILPPYAPHKQRSCTYFIPTRDATSSTRGGGTEAFQPQPASYVPPCAIFDGSRLYRGKSVRA